MPDLYTTEISAPPVDLAMEANHRVANHLSALVAIIQRKIRAIAAGPDLIPRDETMDALKDMGSKILAVSCLHRSFAAPSNHGDIDLEPVLTVVTQSEIRRP